MIKLIAKTLKGKNKLQNAKVKGACDDWKVLQQKDKVLFSDEIGPWLRIVPLTENGEEIMSLSRWVHSSNDKDFDIMTE